MTGGWAATNALRVAVACKFDCSEHEPTQDALALVEAALDAAERVVGHGEDLQPIWQVGAGQDWQEWSDEKNRLRAALRAVREGK